MDVTVLGNGPATPFLRVQNIFETACDLENPWPSLCSRSLMSGRGSVIPMLNTNWDFHATHQQVGWLVNLPCISMHICTTMN